MIGTWDGDPNSTRRGYREADGPDPWRTDDLLLMLLEDVDGEPLGLLSVDDRSRGCGRPPATLQLLGALCLYVQQALRTAKRARRDEDDTRMLARLSEISPQLSECRDRRELYRLVGATITADLGFERVAVYLAAGRRRVCAGPTYAAGTHVSCCPSGCRTSASELCSSPTRPWPEPG